MKRSPSRHTFLFRAALLLMPWTSLVQTTLKAAGADVTVLANNGAGVAPSVARAFRNRANKIALIYEADDGRLEYRLEPTARFLEGLTLEAQPAGGQPRGITVAPGAALKLVAANGSPVLSTDKTVVAELLDFQSDASNNVLSVQQRYTVDGRQANVRTEYAMLGKTLRVAVSSDDPILAAVDFGQTVQVPLRRPVAVPYLGDVFWLAQERLFARTQLDWTASAASAHNGNTALYDALTDGTRNAVRESALITFAWELGETLPNIPNKPSPFRSLLGDKAAIDIWGGNFADDAAWLRELASYRLGPFQIIKHVWQNGGIEQDKLPNVLPANAAQGGDAGLREFVDTARQLGHLVALHENYVDFYPSAAAWNPDDVSRDTKGEMVKAWFTEGIKQQSYAYAPAAILKYAREFSTQVHGRFRSNAMFLDVHTAFPPWFHVDFRAGQPKAGQFRAVWEAHRDLFQFERELFGGPVWGEGNHHWYWSGTLDGVTAQFGTGWPGFMGETAPLFVDFDLLKIHPLQFNHGMGYYERWLASAYKGNWGSRVMPQVKADQYRMQEIAYGHAGFIGPQTWRQLPCVWQEAGLMRDVQARYATAQAEEILYEVGDRMVTSSDALAAAAPLDRVRIAYDNGLTVWCNGRNEPWVVNLPNGAATLPKFGWAAVGAGLTAWTSWRDGVVADFSQTGNRIFANARTTSVSAPALVRVRPAVSGEGAVEPRGRRQFSFRFGWRVNQKLEKDYRPFIHFTDTKAGKNGFQANGTVLKPTSQWREGETVEDGPSIITVPDHVPDGDYSARVGLWDDKGRLHLDGVDDGADRIVLGTLEVRNKGEAFSFKPETREPENLDQLYREHVNVKRQRVDFGPLLTDGSVLMEREKDGAWLLTPFPRETRFVVALEGKTVEALDRDMKPKGPVKAMPAGSRIEFEVGASGVAHYRIR